MRIGIKYFFEITWKGHFQKMNLTPASNLCLFLAKRRCDNNKDSDVLKEIMKYDIYFHPFSKSPFTDLTCTIYYYCCMKIKKKERLGTLRSEL